MKKLIGLKGGQDGTFFEIIDSKKVENIERYPSIKDGVEIPYPLCGSDDELKEYLEHKQKVTYIGYRLTVVGNAVSAESALQEQGYKAMAVNPTTVDIYLEPTHGGPRPGAGRKPTGRSRHLYFITAAEDKQLREYLEQLRSI